MGSYMPKDGIYFTDPRDLEKKLKTSKIDAPVTRDDLRKCKGSDESHDGIYFTNPSDLKDMIKRNYEKDINMFFTSFQSLAHLKNTTNSMSHSIIPTSTQLTSNDCILTRKFKENDFCQKGKTPSKPNLPMFGHSRGLRRKNG